MVVIFADGVPDMVSSLPTIAAVTPAGRPLTEALVAPALNSYTIVTKGSVSQSTCESVPTAEIKSRSSSGSTVIVPVADPLHGLPVVVSS